MTRALMHAIVFLMGTVVAHDARAYGPYGRFDVLATPIWRQTFQLSAGTHVLGTNILTEGGDTVIHLLNAQGQEVAMDDDGGAGFGSRIEYTVSTAGNYTLVVRAYSNHTDGFCEVWVDAHLEAAEVPFAGRRVGGTVGPHDVVQTVLVNGGTSDTILWGFDANDHLVRIDEDDGVGSASKISGTFLEYVLVSPSDLTSGAARVIFNDAVNDHDGDGLGGELELALCTCDQRLGPYACSCGKCCYESNAFVRDTKDSDGDGIRDDLEVFGLDDPTFPQHLPKWGADPAHKDIFVEVDYLVGTLPMDPTSLQEWVDAFAPPRDTQPYLENRDGLPGIRLHVDVGVASSGTSWGDWGGANPHPTGDYEDLSLFTPIRQGIFHYTVTRAGGEGCNSPRNDFKFCWFNYDGVGAAHELGHNLTLNHGGPMSTFPANSKPHYQSLMNYAMPKTIFKTFSFGDATKTLNPDDLCEAEGLGLSEHSKVSYLGQGDFQFLVEGPDCSGGGSSSCGIDWNRDGTISDCDKHIKAAVSDNFSLDPERGRYYWQWSQPPFSDAYADPTASPSLMRFAGRMYLAFRKISGAIALWYTDHDFKTGCPSPFAEGCATWTQLQVFATSQSGGPALGVVNTAGADHLVVVWRDAQKLKYALVTPQNQIGSPVDVPGSDNAAAEPAMANHGSDLLLLYRTGLPDSTGFFRGNTWVAGQSSWQPAADQKKLILGFPFSMIAGAVLAAASYPGGTRAMISLPNGGVYGATWLNYSGSNIWTEVTGTGLESVVFAARPVARIGLAYVAHAASTNLSGGRWYLLYAENPDPNETDCYKNRLRTTMTKGDGTNAPLVWLPVSNYDNRWRCSRGGAALYAWRPNNPETNLRMSIVFPRKPMVDELLEFRPFADGILPASMKDSNDWLAIERGLCTSIRGCADSTCLLNSETNWCAINDYYD